MPISMISRGVKGIGNSLLPINLFVHFVFQEYFYLSNREGRFKYEYLWFIYITETFLSLSAWTFLCIFICFQSMHFK